MRHFLDELFPTVKRAIRGSGCFTIHSIMDSYLGFDYYTKEITIILHLDREDDMFMRLTNGYREDVCLIEFGYYYSCANVVATESHVNICLDVAKAFVKAYADKVA